MLCPDQSLYLPNRLAAGLSEQKKRISVTNPLIRCILLGPPQKEKLSGPLRINQGSGMHQFSGGFGSFHDLEHIALQLQLACHHALDGI